MPARPTQRKTNVAQTVTPAPEVVDPVWLLKAFGASISVALLCAYATLCVLFYQGQWQLVLHPARTSATPATVDGVAFETVRFGAGSTGVPELTGWWLPAATGGEFGGFTILYLPGADGSLVSDQATLATLHEAGVTIFAVDYRGYGQSAGVHPDQRSMTEDAETSWEYVTGTRAVPGDRVIPYGDGVGASLALRLAAVHRSVPALILDRPDFEVERRVRRDSRSTLVPIGLLFHNRFDLLPLLQELNTPKLILSRGDHEDPALLRAADPKMTVAISSSASGSFLPTLRRFLDQYVPRSGQVSTPAPVTQKPR